MDPRASTGAPRMLVLTASVARRYYVDGRSKVDIADEFQLSRFKVARLIESARASGLVRIEIGYAGSIDVDLSAGCRSGSGCATPSSSTPPRATPRRCASSSGKAAAELLGEIVTAEDVLGLAWARAVSAMTASLARLAATPVVQLTGALARNGRPTTTRSSSCGRPHGSPAGRPTSSTRRSSSPTPRQPPPCANSRRSRALSLTSARSPRRSSVSALGARAVHAVRRHGCGASGRS